MSALKLVRKKQTYTALELSRIYPSFHYTAELFKSLTYNAETEEFTVQKPLPTFSECMNTMAELYGVPTSDFGIYLTDLIMEALSLLRGGPEFLIKNKFSKDIKKINTALELVQGITFPEHPNSLIIETPRLRSESVTAILYNAMFALELMKEYYSDPALKGASADTPILEQLERVTDALSFLEVVIAGK